MRRLREMIEAYMRALVLPLARRLADAGITANQVTLAGLATVLAAAALIGAGYLVAGGIFFLAGSLFDLMDGVLARSREQVTVFGAFLDSSLDRVGEGLVFAALVLHFAWQNDPWMAALSVIALTAAFLTSYTRARAEGLGLECTVGLVSRPERVLILGIGLVAGLAAPAIWVLTLLGGFTVAQRMVHVYRQARSPSGGEDAD